MHIENLRLSTQRAATRRLAVSATFTLLGLVLTLGALASPAGAATVAQRPASTTLIGVAGVAAPAARDRRGSVRPPGGEPELDLVSVATTQGPPFAIGFLFAIGVAAAFRPDMERRRAIRRFRTQLRHCDVANLCHQTSPHRESFEN